MKSGFNEGQFLLAIHFFDLGFTPGSATAVKTSLPVHHRDRPAPIEIFCPARFAAMLVKPALHIGTDTRIVGAIVGFDDINKPVCIMVFIHASQGYKGINSLSCVRTVDR